MRVKIDIDCTPEEARTFLGLPDVQPIQRAAMAEIEERMRAGLAAMDPETLLKTWMPGGGASWEQMQKAFWEQFSGTRKGPAE